MLLVVDLRGNVRHFTALFFKWLYYSYLMHTFNCMMGSSTDLITSILILDCVLMVNTDAVAYDEWNSAVDSSASSAYTTFLPNNAHSFGSNSRESAVRIKKETPFEEEIQNLLKSYPQNQDLIRNIDVSYYQIIYPVMLHHHEKVGVSTRGTLPSKMGRHYHKTSLLIKAFNYKFRLDLELNTHLLAPNLMQKHFIAQDAEQISKQEIEHCYYQGTVKDIPGASAAFQTCEGISGVIHIGNETFVIHPFYTSDTSRHPHVIFESNAKINSGCANKGNLEWRIKSPPRKTKHTNNIYHYHQLFKRDVREATKYIEIALIVDRSMFERRNGSTRAIVVQDAIQMANIVDLYYRRINTRVSVVYIETWQRANQIPIDKNTDISRTLLNFNDYVTHHLFSVDRDVAHLITGENFINHEAGIAVPQSVCTPKSQAVIADLNPYEPHITAATMAHMIGHNIGMGHDDERHGCFCQDWHGCIMQQSIVGQENIYPYTFSDCSLEDYINGFRESRTMCLLNKPNEIISPHRHCGNKIVEENEDCDCGSMDNCEKIDPCCDPITCKLKKESECSATSSCCSECKFSPYGTPCRAATNECDLSEYCSGNSGECPSDVYKKNGNLCDGDRGYCFNGLCPTLDRQCEHIWGNGGVVADRKCYDQFNAKGTMNGNCGLVNSDSYKACDKENVLCGTLQCSEGNNRPNAELNHEFSKTTISIEGTEYECKSTRNKNISTTAGLVQDGTRCGSQRICVNQSCVSLFPYISNNKCPSNHQLSECSSRGVCSNINTCICKDGWTGHDCSVQDIRPPAVVAQTTLSTPNDTNTTPANGSIESQMEKKETIYENIHSTNTVNLVGVLMLAVGGVFTVFTTVALCYRRTTMPKVKGSDPASEDKKSQHRKSDAVPVTETEEITIDIPQERNSNYSRTSSCGHRRGSSNSSDSHRVYYRPASQQGTSAAGNISAIPLDKSNIAHTHAQHHLRRVSSRSDSMDCRECKYSHRSCRDDAGSVISLRSDGMSKIPEKGILKKSFVNKEDYWNNEPSSHELFTYPSAAAAAAAATASYGRNSPSVVSAGGVSACAARQPPYTSISAKLAANRARQKSITQMEKTLKSLNSYHEDILAAIKNASGSCKCATCSSMGTSYSTENLIRHSSTSVLVGSKRSRSQEPLCDNGADVHTRGTGSESASGAAHLMERLIYSLGLRRQHGHDDDEGPLRIRNLEDLVKQLEYHSGRHVDLQNLTLEDIRVSEPEADRHYTIDTPEDDMSDEQFVYGQFRRPNRIHPHSYYSNEPDNAYDSSATDPTNRLSRNQQQILMDAQKTMDDYDTDFSSHRPLMRSASEELVPIGQNT